MSCEVARSIQIFTQRNKQMHAAHACRSFLTRRHRFGPQFIANKRSRRRSVAVKTCTALLDLIDTILLCPCSLQGVVCILELDVCWERRANAAHIQLFGHFEQAGCKLCFAAQCRSNFLPTFSMLGYQNAPRVALLKCDLRRPKSKKGGPLGRSLLQKLFCGALKCLNLSVVSVNAEFDLNMCSCLR